MKEKAYIKGKAISIAKTMMLLGSMNGYITSCNTQEHGNNVNYLDQCANGDINHDNILYKINELKNPRDKNELIMDFFETYEVKPVEFIKILSTAKLKSPWQFVEKFLEKNKVSYAELIGLLKDTGLNEYETQKAIYSFIEGGNIMTYENFVELLEQGSPKSKHNLPILVNCFLEKTIVEWKEAIRLIIRHNYDLGDRPLIENIRAVFAKNSHVQFGEAFEYLQNLNLSKDAKNSIIIDLFDKNPSLCNLLKCLEANVCDSNTICNSNTIYMFLVKFIRDKKDLKFQDIQKILEYVVDMDEFFKSQFLHTLLKKIDGTLTELIELVKMVNGGDKCNTLILHFANANLNKITSDEFVKIFENTYPDIVALTQLTKQFLKINGNNFETFLLIWKAVKVDSVDRLDFLRNFLDEKKCKTEESIKIVETYHQIFKAFITSNYTIEKENLEIDANSLINYFNSKTESKSGDDNIKLDLIELFFKNIPINHYVDIEILKTACMKNEMHKTRVIKYILDRNPYAFNFDFFKIQLVDLGYKNIPEDLLLNFLNKNEVNYKKFIVEVLPCFLKEELKSKAVGVFLEKTKVSLDEFKIILAEAKFQDKQHIVPVYCEFLKNTKVTVDAFLEILTSTKNISIEAKYKLLSAFLNRNKDTTVDELIEMFKHKELINLKNDAEKIWELFKIVRSKNESKVVIELQKFFQSVYPFSEAMQMEFFTKGIDDHLINPSNFKFIDFNQIKKDDNALYLLYHAAEKGIIPANDEKVILELVRNRCHSVYASIIELCESVKLEECFTHSGLTELENIFGEDNLKGLKFTDILSYYDVRKSNVGLGNILKPEFKKRILDKLEFSCDDLTLKQSQVEKIIQLVGNEHRDCLIKN